jgi:dienelactone hydrolase
VRGAPPRQIVCIRATTEDDKKQRWSSEAQFRADDSGLIDVAKLESREGTYRGVSAMGLFWSMRLTSEHPDGRAMFAKIGVAPDRIAFEVESGGQVVAAFAFQREFVAPGTTTRDLTLNDEAGGRGECAVGRLFIPPAHDGASPPPVVIVLSGSGGGLDLDKAAVLSRHGFATLALAYFGVPPLPEWLHRIPLDYFEAALAWLAAQPGIDTQRTGILGVSRGAELALLLASRLPQIRAVVAYAPSSVAWSSGGRDNSTGEIIPCWTWRGEPITFAPLPLRNFMLRSAIPVVALRRPVMFRNLFRAGLRNRAAIASAAIPVEQIAGPILLVSSGDDHVWPAAEMSEQILARLKHHGFRHKVDHLHYPGAGHMLRYPFLPTTSRQSRNPHLHNARFSFGGTAEADAEAQRDSWRRTINFFRANL